MKICKKILIILLISIMLSYSIIPSKTVFADDDKLSGSAEAGEIIASFAIDMVSNHASETIYDYGSYWPKVGMPENYGRLMAYQGVKVSGYPQASDGTLGDYATDKYFMDCVGFVSFCIHNSLGISGNSDGNFVVIGAIRTMNYFENKNGATLQKGDIMYSAGHVMIYLGNNTFAESSDINNPGWHIKFRTGPVSGFSVARITDSSAKSILRSQTKKAWDGHGLAGGINIPQVDDSGEFAKYIGEGNINGLGDSNKFYYNGIPKAGEYLGKTKNGNWFFEKLENAADWLLGIITMNVKIQAIGWTSIFENLANTVVESITTKEVEERITVEDVIYNRVPILDVNLFDFEHAGGQELAENNIIYILRAKIASWYVVVRTICIILLLFVLIYLGIRTAIASMAKDKAEYKQKLIGWLVGFIVVMFIHYFMIIVLNLNQIAINWIKPDGSTSLVYEQMRSYAYEIPASKGWTGTIMYVFLVYYLIKMLFFYFKRVLIVYILAIISPAMGIVYSMQKIKGKSKALGMWMKEFAFNVIIQFVHAIIYTIMMGVIVGIIAKLTVWRIIPYAILLIITLDFLLESEDIIKNIFKIESNSLKSILQTVFDYKNRFATALAIGGFAYKQGKKAVVKAYDKNLTANLNAKYDKFKLPEDSEFAKAVNAEIDALKEQEKEHIQEANSNAIKFAKGQFSNAVALVAGVPALFEKPIAGGVTLVATASNLDGSLGIGKYGKDARNLDENTEGSQYVYVDPPEGIANLTATGANNRSGTNSNSSGSLSSTNNASGNTVSANSNNQRTIRTYNTKKIRKLTVKNVGLSVLSWGTIGRSKNMIDVYKEGRTEKELIEKVYSTRIEKLSVIGKMSVKEIKTINQELERIKANDYPPVYYEPKENEDRTQIAMNQRLREKYREILEKNIIQIYEGIDKETIEGHVLSYEGNKVNLKSVEEIAKEYLEENECNVGNNFEDNLDDLLTQKLIDTVEERKNGFEKLKLQKEIEEKVKRATENNRGNNDRIKEEVSNAITEDEKDEIVSKLSAKDLTELISKTLETKGSIEINRDFRNLQEPVENLKQLNDEAEATTGNKIYTTGQLLDLIMNKDIMK